MSLRSKHSQLHRLLRDKIVNGICPPGSRLPTETELIEEHQVSSITVIRALNDLAREGLIVRRRRSGTFVVDPTHRPLIAGRNLRLALLIDQSILPNFEFIQGFHRAVIDGVLQGWGVHTTPTVARVPPTEVTRAVWKAPLRGVTVEAIGEEHATRRKHPPIEAIRNGGYDGVVAVSIVVESFIQQLQTLKIPCVLADYLNIRSALNSDQVYFDPMPGYFAAVKHLSQQGARRIHYVGCLLRAPSESAKLMSADPDRFKPERGRRDPDSLLRLNAYQLALKELDLPESDRSIHFTWPYSPFIQNLAEELAALPAGERPDAVVCHSADTARIFIEVFASKGLRLAGTGAAEFGYLGSALPIFASGKAMGEIAASLVVWKLQQPSRAPLRVGVPMHFPPVEDAFNAGLRTDATIVDSSGSVATTAH